MVRSAGGFARASRSTSAFTRFDAPWPQGCGQPGASSRRPPCGLLRMRVASGADEPRGVGLRQHLRRQFRSKREAHRNKKDDGEPRGCENRGVRSGRYSISPGRFLMQRGNRQPQLRWHRNVLPHGLASRQYDRRHKTSGSLRLFPLPIFFSLSSPSLRSLGDDGCGGSLTDL
jgi:hypothetical protein